MDDNGRTHRAVLVEEYLESEGFGGQINPKT